MNLYVNYHWNTCDRDKVPSFEIRTNGLVSNYMNYTSRESSKRKTVTIRKGEYRVIVETKVV